MSTRTGRATPLSLLLALWLLAACTGAASAPAPAPTPMPAPTATAEWDRPGWTLRWQDEFSGPAIDRANWTFDIGDGTLYGIPGWGNDERQFYTERPENARIEDGVLVIEAREERIIRGDYTSARLKTEGLQELQFGRIEARIQIPRGQGLWPAFWMLGTEGDRWPGIGEIDIMENIGREPHQIHGTVHGPGYSGGNGVGGSLIKPAAPFADDYHIYAIEWEPDAIRWYVDDRLFSTVTPEDVPGDWVFDDHPFYLILNVAVGGHWPGDPDETTPFPQQMRVDYVRVYQ